MNRVIVLDQKHTITKIMEWLERNVGPVTNRGFIAEGLDNMPEGKHWRLKHQITTPKGQRIVSGLFCEFDDAVDEGIILYFALRFV